MTRLLLPALALALCSACYNWSVRHDQRVDPGGTFDATVHIDATDSGSADVTVCAGLPEGWSVKGKVRFEGKDGDQAFSGVAQPSQALAEVARGGSDVQGLTWTCFELPTREYTSAAEGDVTVTLKADKGAAGLRTLRWWSGRGTEASEGYRGSTIYVGSPKEWAKAELGKQVDEAVSDGQETSAELTELETKANSWLAGIGSMAEADVLAAKRHFAAAPGQLERLRTLLAEPLVSDAQRAVLVDAESLLAVKHEAWRVLWPKVVTGLTNSASNALDGVRDPATGQYDTTKVGALDTEVRVALETVNDLHDKVELSADIDALFTRCMPLAFQLGNGDFASGVSGLCIKVCKTPETLAYAHFTQANVHSANKTGPEPIEASCHAAYTTFPTGFATWGAAQCTTMLGSESWKTAPEVSGAP